MIRRPPAKWSHHHILKKKVCRKRKIDSDSAVTTNKPKHQNEIDTKRCEDPKLLNFFLPINLLRHLSSSYTNSPGESDIRFWKCSKRMENEDDPVNKQQIIDARAFGERHLENGSKGARERNAHLCFLAHQMVLAYDLMVIAESMNVVDNLANVLLLYELKWKKIEEFDAWRLELKSIYCALLRANMVFSVFSMSFLAVERHGTYKQLQWKDPKQALRGTSHGMPLTVGRA
ncbi:hypothetical protein Tco_1138271 [Tanacetum coccineum]